MADSPSQNHPYEPPAEEMPRREHTPRAQRQRRRSVPITVNIAPMIDVTFLLLIFFLVTTTFGRPEGSLASKLPTDSGAASVALPISPIVVRLQQIGTSPSDCSIHIDNYDQVPADFDALAELLMEIQKQPGFDTETPIVIKPDEGLLWDHVINGYNAAIRCGYANIAFAG